MFSKATKPLEVIKTLIDVLDALKKSTVTPDLAMTIYDNEQAMFSGIASSADVADSSPDRDLDARLSTHPTHPLLTQGAAVAEFMARHNKVTTYSHAAKLGKPFPTPIERGVAEGTTGNLPTWKLFSCP